MKPFPEGTDLFQEVRVAKDYQKAIELVPYAHFLGVTFEEKDEELIFTLPFDEKLIGNPKLPALHGGAVAGFMENAAIVYLMWTKASVALPKNIDFTIDFILSGRPRETHAACHVVRQGKNIANIQITAWQEQRQTPIAIARSHFKVFRDY